MTPDIAAWVRTHVWTPAIRRDWTLGLDACVCQRGLSRECRAGDCGACPGRTGYPHPETYVTTPRGGVADLPGEYVHPTPSASGAHRVRHAQVWLADRVCRWACPHECHTAAASAAGTVPQTRPPIAEQLDLLTLI